MEWGSYVCKVERVFRAPPEARTGTRACAHAEALMCQCQSCSPAAMYGEKSQSQSVSSPCVDLGASCMLRLGESEGRWRSGVSHTAKTVAQGRSVSWDAYTAGGTLPVAWQPENCVLSFRPLG
jgi:hypothetical protein